MTFVLTDWINPTILTDVSTTPIIVTDDKELLKNAANIALFDTVPYSPIPYLTTSNELDSTEYAITALEPLSKLGEIAESLHS